VVLAVVAMEQIVDLQVLMEQIILAVEVEVEDMLHLVLVVLVVAV
jgi:hypothetical protein